MYTSAVIAAIFVALVSAENPAVVAEQKDASLIDGHGHHGHKECSSNFVYMSKQPCKKPRWNCPSMDHCKKCEHDFGEFFVLHDNVPFWRADCACRAKGGQLAHITSANFQSAVSAVFKCVGPNRHAWIESWNGDNYHGACLALYTGSQPGGGSIAVPLSCESHVPILCQKTHQECHDNHCWRFSWEWQSSHEIDECDRCHPRDHHCRKQCSSESWSSSSHCECPSSSSDKCESSSSSDKCESSSSSDKCESSSSSDKCESCHHKPCHCKPHDRCHHHRDHHHGRPRSNDPVKNIPQEIKNN